MSLNEGPVDSKRKKKILKKSSKGDIHNFESYRECVLLGIHSKPEFYMVPDKTRQHAKHDLNISEVRELLISLFSDEPNLVPKYFSVKNKGFVRNVLVLHISDCEDPIGTLSAFSSRAPTTVRISRQDGELSSFPEKLFSISNNEATFMIEEKERKDMKSMSSNNKNKNKNDVLNSKNVVSNALPAGHKCSMDDCVLSQSTQIMWGYPIRLANTTSSFSSSTSSSINTVTAMSSSSKGTHTTSSSSPPLSLPPPPSTLDTSSSSSSSSSASSSLLDKRSRETSDSEEGSDPKKVRTEDSAEQREEMVATGSEHEIFTMEDNSSNGCVNDGSVDGVRNSESSSDHDDTKESNVNVNVSNNSENESENDVSIDKKKDMFDVLSPVGVRAGTVPSQKETCTIFNQINNINTVNINHINHTNGAVSSQENTTSSPPSSSSSSSSSPTSLLFPSFSVSIRSTRESTPHGTGVTGFRDTVCSTSQDFNRLWMSSSDCTAPLLVAAVDCEMCDTSKGLELTRLTVLDQSHKVILDTLVKPSTPITNYRTQWSGITEEILTDVTVTLEQAQLAFMRIVSKETFLIGHSLDSDLKSLFITHAKCVDTAILFPHPRGFPYRLKLKELAETHLNIIIQRNSNNFTSKIKKILSTGTSMNDEVDKVNDKKIETEVIEIGDKSMIDLGAEIEKKRKEMQDNKTIPTPLNTNTDTNTIPIRTHNNGIGHDSIEDASTALRLVTLKLEKGVDFGSKIPQNGRVALSRFLIGTGTTDCRNDGVMDGSSSGMNGDSAGEDNNNNNNDNNDDENGMRIIDKNSSVCIDKTIDPSFAFFWTMKEECTAMGHCLPPNSTFTPHSTRSVIVPMVQQTIREGRVTGEQEGKERNGEKVGSMNAVQEGMVGTDLLRNQLMCYIGVQDLESKVQGPSKVTSKVYQKVDSVKSDDANCDDKKDNDDKNSENNEKNENISISDISSIVDTLKKSLESTGLGSIMIITAQLPLSHVISLSRQKKACDSPQSVSIWTPAMEEKLRDAYVKCNYASMVTIAI